MGGYVGASGRLKLIIVYYIVYLKSVVESLFESVSILRFFIKYLHSGQILRLFTLRNQRLDFTIQRLNFNILQLKTIIVQ